MFTAFFVSHPTNASIASNLAESLSFDKLPIPTGAPQYNYNVDLSGWTECATKLRDCRPTKCSLPNPVQIAFLKMAVNMGGGRKMNGALYTQAEIDALIQNTYQNYAILGWKKDKCIVTIEAKPHPKEYVSGYHLNDKFIKEAFPITKVNCTFEKKDLEVLAKSASHMQMEIQIQGPDSKVHEQAGEILVRSCQPNQD